VNLLDPEVYAVIIGLAVVASAAGIVSLIDHHEPFEAIGLLGPDCTATGYPDFALPGENLTFCLMIVNDMGAPEAYRVVYKFAQPPSLPGEDPLDAPALADAVVVVPDNSTVKIRITAPIPLEALPQENATLVFELYRWSNDTWAYTGKYVYLRVLVEVPPP